MAVTCTLSNYYKYAKVTQLIDLSGDSIKVLLMRSGFVFNKDLHGMKKNIKGTISRSDISFTVTSNYIDTAAGDFEAAGFVPGGKITVSGSGSNNSTFTISSMPSETRIVTSEALVQEDAGASVTITGADELAAGSGYDQDDKLLTGQSVDLDLTNDRAEFSCNNVVWSASGGNIGPTPGAILYDDTSTGDVIIGYIDFGGEQTAPNGADFTISTLLIRES